METVYSVTHQRDSRAQLMDGDYQTYIDASLQKELGVKIAEFIIKSGPSEVRILREVVSESRHSITTRYLCYIRAPEENTSIPLSVDVGKRLYDYLTILTQKEVCFIPWDDFTQFMQHCAQKISTRVLECRPETTGCLVRL